VVVRWSVTPPVAAGDVRARRAAGRLASRSALAEAIDAWRAAFGDAGWQRAPVVHDATGAPSFDHPAAPAIALAHTAGLGGAAIARPGVRAAGIDAEPVDAPGARALRRLAEGTGEAALPGGDGHWPLRLWCAKEAAVKAERMPADLLGRTLRIESVATITASGEQRVRVRSHLGNAISVCTAVSGAHVRAWTE
jgi:4'-phosphopantetheinyl transferase EntD